MKFKFNHNAFYIIILVVIILMLIQIEITINKNYAPESLLIRVNDPNGLPQQNASCKADISSEQINVNDKSLNGLNSIYDFVDANTWNYQKGDKGFSGPESVQSFALILSAGKSPYSFFLPVKL